MRVLVEKRHGKSFSKYKIIHYECDYGLHYRVKIKIGSKLFIHVIVTKCHLPEEEDDTILLTHY